MFLFLNIFFYIDQIYLWQQSDLLDQSFYFYYYLASGNDKRPFFFLNPEPAEWKFSLVSFPVIALMILPIVRDILISYEVENNIFHY